MITKLLLASVLLAGLATLPAMATPYCNDDRGGVSIHFGFGNGLHASEADQNQFDLMQLRQTGVDANSVERWNGCIRAFVRSPSGGETMKYYDPNTFREVF